MNNSGLEFAIMNNTYIIYLNNMGLNRKPCQLQLSYSHYVFVRIFKLANLQLFSIVHPTTACQIVVNLIDFTLLFQLRIVK